jgi:hypothetical protein
MEGGKATLNFIFGTWNAKRQNIGFQKAFLMK